jgi:hypothetical protein
MKVKTSKRLLKATGEYDSVIWVSNRKVFRCIRRGQVTIISRVWAVQYRGIENSIV